MPILYLYGALSQAIYNLVGVQGAADFKMYVKNVCQKRMY